MTRQPNEHGSELLDLLTTAPTDVDAADPAAGDSAATRDEWSQALDALRAADGSPAVPSSFNDDLRQRWQAELAAAAPVAPVAAPRRPRRDWTRAWRVLVPLAAAAVLAILLLWPGGVLDRDRSGPSAGVAWGDVVQAMRRVQHFHLIAFDDDPRRTDEKLRLFRMDLFYQQPGRWRAQGMGYVGFLDGEQRQTWNIDKRAWVAPGERAPELFPREFAQEHEKLGTLGAVLSSIFDGKVPRGEPVKSDEVASAQGIDVFDYAADASDKWVRIWVLRQSRLPLKMHLYYPGSDAFMLVTFDYSDPQPAAFFDPAAFATAAADIESPARAYSIGSRPVAGTLPRAANQIHETEGGYHAPTIRRAVSNGAGDIAVIADTPRNLTPAGSDPFRQGYRRATDNWGNTFICYGGGWGSPGGNWYFTPVPPIKIAAPPRKLTLSFVIEADYAKEQVLRTETIDVAPPPPPATAATQPTAGPARAGAERPDFGPDFELQKRSAFEGYLRANGSVADQLAEIDRRLAADPQDIAPLCWKFKLLREHDRDAAAWSLFESRLRDRIFATPRSLNDHYVEAFQYLLHLDAGGRSEELRKLSETVQQAIAAARASTDRGAGLQMLRMKEQNPLAAAAQLPEWREQFKDDPKIIRTLASRDGMVFVELQTPKPPEGWDSNGWDGQSPFGWFWQPRAGEGWRPQARLAKLEQGRLWLVFRGSGATLQLRGDVLLRQDNYGSVAHRNDAKLHWERTVTVPPPTIDDMKKWWLSQTGGDAKTWWPDPPPASTQPRPARPAGEWLQQADAAREAGRWAEALELYRKVLAAPKEQWPEIYTGGVGVDPDSFESSRRMVQVSIAQCLAELGKFDEAKQVASELESALPASPDLSDPQQGYIARDALAADLAVPRVMLKRGDAHAAAAELDRIARRRPNFADLPQGMLMVQRGSNRFGWNPKSVQQDAWRAYDTLWWDAHDQLQN